jgi:dsRNA-specific ribonuclease
LFCSYAFRAPALAVEALTHGSCLASRSYQRLEFLGDAVLDAGLTWHNYSAAP